MNKRMNRHKREIFVAKDNKILSINEAANEIQEFIINKKHPQSPNITHLLPTNEKQIICEECLQHCNQDIYLDEVKYVVKLMPNDKAPGWDNINTILIKKGGLPMILFLRKLFSEFWCKSNYPD